MFDANIRYRGNGDKFFAEIGTLDEDSFMYCMGVRESEILVFCTMIDNDKDNNHYNPLVKVFLRGGGGFIVRPSYDKVSYSTFFVYAGNADLKGFLPQDEEKLLPVAKQILKELSL